MEFTIMFRALMVAFAFILTVGTCATVLRIVMAPVNSTVGVVEKTLDPDNVIYNYEWFKNQYNDILAKKVTLANIQGQIDNIEKAAGPEKKSWDNTWVTEWQRLNQVKTGAANQLQGMIGEYNARSAMTNRNMFKRGEIPESIPQE